MDNNTLIKMELEIMAQKVINMVTVNNSQVEEAIKEAKTRLYGGIKKTDR